MTSAFPEADRISVNSWSPPVDIEETDEDYLVEADLPGVRPEDVTIDLQGRELRIRGESCTADLEHGVLRLRLPKAPSSVRQRIPVQARAQLGSEQSLKNSDQPQTPTT